MKTCQARLSDETLFCLMVIPHSSHTSTSTRTPVTIAILTSQTEVPEMPESLSALRILLVWILWWTPDIKCDKMFAKLIPNDSGGAEWEPNTNFAAPFCNQCVQIPKGWTQVIHNSSSACNTAITTHTRKPTPHHTTPHQIQTHHNNH